LSLVDGLTESPGGLALREVMLRNSQLETEMQALKLQMQTSHVPAAPSAHALAPTDSDEVNRLKDTVKRLQQQLARKTVEVAQLEQRLLQQAQAFSESSVLSKLADALAEVEEFAPYLHRALYADDR
jgi:hypothetical protein